MANIKWDKIHEKTKYVLPGEHYGLDWAWKSSTRLVNKTSDGLGTWGDKWGINSDIPRKVEGWSERDSKDFDTWGENTMGGIGAVLGGMYAYSSMGAGSAGTAGGTGGSGALGGTTYAEAGGGTVTSGADGALSWVNADGTTGSAAGNASGWNWSDSLKKGGQGMQNAGRAEDKPEEEIKESDVDFERPNYKGDPYAYSSKRLKTAPAASMRAVMARGAAGADPIDQNGVHMAAIQALTQRMAAVKARIAELKGKQA